MGHAGKPREAHRTANAIIIFPFSMTLAHDSIYRIRLTDYKLSSHNFLDLIGTNLQWVTKDIWDHETVLLASPVVIAKSAAIGASLARSALAYSSHEVLDRLARVEGLLSNLVSSLRNGAPVQDPCRQSKPRTEPVPAPPILPSQEVLVGDGERGNFVDDSVFVGLFLGDPPRQRPIAGTKTRDPIPNATTQHISPHYGIAATDVFGSDPETISVPPHVLTRLWIVYLQNVDPLIKILHIPTIQPVMLGVAAKPQGADNITQALLYTTAFAATTSMSSTEVATQLGIERLVLLRHFMREIDGAFTRAQFLLYPNVQGLKALAIYLTALRTFDTGRTIWTLTGLAIRIAESLGVHEDGSRLGLGPFETEMRCRLWWHLTALDATAPESHGFNNTMADRGKIFRLPLNVNDTELWPQMDKAPAGRDEWTETTFSIMNLDLCRNLRHAVSAVGSADEQTREAKIQQTESSMAHRWLRFAPKNSDICRAAESLLRISVAKARFILMLQAWLSAPMEQECRYRYLPHSLFTTAIELLEQGYLLQSGKLFPGYAWFYQQHPQLYALFLTLRTLVDSPERGESERARLAVDNYIACLADFEEANERRGKKSCVWAAMGPLRDRARESVRQRDATEETTIPVAASPKMPSGENFGTGTSQSWNAIALEPLAFDNILTWHDFSDLFDVI
ncbi:fungal specific transcription factor domain-containing protein [Colletotrichum nymphaeae SA-01]|uniref:Fungal specific transcription factor domain-containing protein n=1 Tax=Colletotrichum nymphaeae SA-01 TaxID=1460502 RepID=A0A135T351_9PEZI|nr:fungal specific transcription factor domain-containing protein [Colletotrichum nymphaeae SA-01]